MNEITALDAREFRNALGCFATGVTIVTTVDPGGEPVGLTVNSFNSVSLDPPLVLFSVGRHAYSLTVLLETEHFAVNVLRESQQALSDRFARAASDKWAGIDFRSGENGCPLLPGVLARLECHSRHAYMGGDHVIFVGEVERMTYDPDGVPLLYFRGGYRGIRE